MAPFDPQSRPPRQQPPRGRGGELRVVPGPHSGGAVEPPESVRLVRSLFVGGFVLEVVHQIFAVVKVWLDPQIVLGGADGQQPERMKALIEASPVSPSVLAVVGQSFSSVLWLVLVGLCFFGVQALWRGSRSARGWRFALLYFGVYSVMRLLSLFVTIGQVAAVPVGVVLADGALQILSGVAGVLLLIVLNKRDTVDWLSR